MQDKQDKMQKESSSVEQEFKSENTDGKAIFTDTGSAEKSRDKTI